MPLDFDAASSEYCTGAVTGLVADTVGTISLWCRPETLNNGSLFFIGDDTGAFSHFLLRTINTGKLYAHIIYGGPLRSVTTDNVVYAAGDLLHIGFVQDNGGTISIYINGVAVPNTVSASWANRWFAYLEGLATLNVLSIGMNRDSTPDLPFNGIIYDAAYWSTNLSAAQMLRLYAGGRIVSGLPLRMAAANCKRYWPLLENTGATTKDRASGYDLALTAAPDWISRAGTIAMPAQKRLMGVY